MQSLELGQISPTESKLRRRGRRYFSTSRAYLSLYRRRFAAYNFGVWKARLKTLALLALKVTAGFLVAFAVWIGAVVLYEIWLGLIADY